ncbi:selenocysteine-specific translation elongation factor [Tahibacter sp. UC22_41]|uniref:selenocysteine-specific translation elongation factor n=1 Tax=Tahibacter sp. UC22_41 TaxID=3350178 RepID=UPI0036DF403B
MIVGTAGHIDHGKTTLVRALTGVDTDRLKEEKQRGISIELGYAYLPDANDAAGEALGFVDVPGHERLIHTMVAGASGIDFALLVVAADDGVMPQTREHVAILDLLAVTRGAVALTKVDRVDDERIDAVRIEVAELLAATALKTAPVFAVAATNPGDDGVAELRAHILAAAAETCRRADDGLFRLAVDRVFTLPGHGTVAAGLVTDGQVGTGDVVQILPAGIAARVRAIHAHNRAAAIGRAGQRCALNLAQVDTSAIARGDWIADPRGLATTTRIDVELRLFAMAAPLTQWALLHVHFGTTHRLARVVLLDAERLAPGSRCRVQLVFDTPVCARPGDRYIVRDAQAVHTVGGGMLLDPFAPARRRRSAERLQRLAAIADLLAGHGLDALLDGAVQGLAESELVKLTGQLPDRLPLPAATHRIATGSERLVIADRHWQALRGRVLGALRDFHAQAPDETGPDVGRLRRIAVPALALPVWLALVDELVREQRIVRKGPWLHLPEHIVTLSADERRLADAVLPLLAAGRFDPPWTRDLARQVKVSEELMRRLLRKLAAEGEVLQIVPDLFYARAAVGELAELAARLAADNGTLDVAAYRDGVGTGRKRAVQILEFFDRVGYTRRQRDARILRSDSGWKSTLAAPANR